MATCHCGNLARPLQYLSPHAYWTTETRPRFRVAAAPGNSGHEGSAILPAVLLRVQAAADRGANLVLNARPRTLDPVLQRHHDEVVLHWLTATTLAGATVINY